MAVFTIIDGAASAREAAGQLSRLLTGPSLDLTEQADPLASMLGGGGGQGSSGMLSVIAPTGGQRLPTPNVQRVRITGTTGTADLYDAEIVTVNPDDGTVTVVQTGVQVRALSGAFSVGDILNDAQRTRYTTNPHPAFTAHALPILSINGDRTRAQLLTVGTSGTDFAIDDSTPGTHKFNLPDASRTARGAITTGTQTIGGHKTFYDDFTAGYIAAWSVYSLDINTATGFAYFNGPVEITYPYGGYLAIDGAPSTVTGYYSSASMSILNNFSSTDSDDASVGWRLELESQVVAAGGPAGGGVLYCDSGTLLTDLTPRFGIKTQRSGTPTRYHGQWGTDSVGNVISGGIVTTIGSSALGTSRGGTGIDSSGVTDGQLLIGKTSDHSWNMATLTAGSGITITNGAGSITIAASGGGGGLSDGDYGDIVVSGSGTTLTIDADSVTYAKLQNVSATSRVLGRKSSGAGDAEECTLSEVLDFVGSAAQGDILYRGASAWARLATASTASGQQLRSGGTGTNPGWVDGHGPGMVQNLNLYATATAGALTIELLTNSGTTPSATDYGVIPFRSVGTSVGFEKYRHITGAKTLTIPSGATLGATSGTPFRVWVGAVDSMVDAIPETGTIQLFAINCYDGASTIYPLRDNQMANPTAIGTGSDSSGVMYSPATVSGAARAIRILGYFEWPSGLTTAGTWTFASTDIAQLYHPGVPLPGEVIQQAGYTDSAVATGSTAIPFDNTKPQNTEGVQYFSQAITVQSAANVMEIDAKAIGCASGAEFLAMALFRDSGADALRTTMCTVNSANWANQMHLAHRVIAGSVGSTTWKIRIGGETNVYTWTLNGQAGSGFFNSTFDSHLFVREIMT